MTDPARNVVEVAQGDREAAAAVPNTFGGFTKKQIRDGKHDDLPIVQAFARHRLASLAISPEGARELREALEGLELSEDGYSLCVTYDGDADDQGRAIVVGGDTVVTFADSDTGEAVREIILKIMGQSA